MSGIESPAAKVPPGWYPHPATGTTMWWDGGNWADAASVDAVERRRGTLLLEIARKAPDPTLRIYENEVWKIMPAGTAGSLGGSIVGVRAEMAAQNQYNSTSALSSRNYTFTAGTTLHVVAPDFEFTFELIRKEMNEATRRQLSWAVEFLNNRSRDLSKETIVEVAPSAGISVADELAKFAALRDQGVITDEEFATKKAQLLA